MYATEPCIGGDAGVGRVSPIVIGLICLWCCTVLLPGQVSLARAQTSPRPETVDGNESQPLTAAQEKARQLAVALHNERESRAETAAAASPGIVVEQPPAPGQRPVVPLFAAKGIEGRLVGGQQTLASPVTEISAGAAADANRPMFMPATQAAVAVEVLFE
jgi:hypothetical protein